MFVDPLHFDQTYTSQSPVSKFRVVVRSLSCLWNIYKYEVNTISINQYSYLADSLPQTERQNVKSVRNDCFVQVTAPNLVYHQA